MIYFPQDIYLAVVQMFLWFTGFREFFFIDVLGRYPFQNSKETLLGMVVFCAGVLLRPVEVWVDHSARGTVHGVWVAVPAPDVFA